MRIGHEEGEEVSPEMTTHLDRCLGCMACVTACPSGVQYDRLIERARPQIERHGVRTRRERALRSAIFALFTHPGRLRAVVPFMALQQRLRLPAPFSHLAAEGWEVHAPRTPRCCGALQLHTGVEDESRELARATIAAYEDFDHVVVNAAGCGSAMKEYGYLFEGEERAEAFSAKVLDVHELLAAREPRAERKPLPLKVAYHDACHLAHAQQVRTQPRALLRGIPALELLEPAEWELCCGSAGIYNLTHPGPAAELGERKAANLRATGADAIAAANPGCALQI